MFIVGESVFNQLVSQAIDSLPERFRKEMKNVAFVVEDEPSEAQRQKLQLTQHQSLFGLYEGIPLTRRNNSYTMVLPDKITIFKSVIEHASDSAESLQAQIKRTVWHEVAHHFGLDHGRIEELERKNKT